MLLYICVHTFLEAMLRGRENPIHLSINLTSLCCLHLPGTPPEYNVDYKEADCFFPSVCITSGVLSTLFAGGTGGDV